MKVISKSGGNVVLEATSTEVKLLLCYDDVRFNDVFCRGLRVGEVIEIPDRYVTLMTLKRGLDSLVASIEEGFLIVRDDDAGYQRYKLDEAARHAKATKATDAQNARHKKIERARAERDKAQARYEKLIGPRDTCAIEPTKK